MELAIEVFRDGGNNNYIASCPRLEIYTYGHTVNTAISRLEKVVNFYMESAKEMGVTLEEVCLGNKSSKFYKWQHDNDLLIRRRIN
ncbi:TPA: hypothetical protein DCX15_00750 [bacterium]|nr:hypothetical protein [bacterium]